LKEHVFFRKSGSSFQELPACEAEAPLKASCQFANLLEKQKIF